MPGVVLVHGNPETAAIWQPLIEVLGAAGVETLSPPGFGARFPTVSGQPPTTTPPGSSASSRPAASRSTWWVTTGVAATLRGLRSSVRT